MKKLIIKSILFTFIILTLSIHCSQPWYSKHAIVTSAIDVAMGIRTMIQKPIMAINPDKFIKAQKNKLALIEKNIRATKKKQIRILLQESKLTKEQIAQTFTILQLVHESRKKYFSQDAHINTLHDPELADHIINIKKQLAAEGLNADNINILQDSNINDRANNSNNIRLHYHIAHNGTIKLDNYYIEVQPDTIRFNPLYLNDKDQEAVDIHEAEHSIQGHSSILTVFNLAYDNNINDYTIKASPHYQKLRQIIEQEAEIFPALRNAKSATLMRNYRYDNDYPGMLYREHYLQLSDVDETHKMIAYLEHIKKHPHKPIPAMKKIKVHQFPASSYKIYPFAKGFGKQAE